LIHGGGGLNTNPFIISLTRADSISPSPLLVYIDTNVPVDRDRAVWNSKRLSITVKREFSQWPHFVGEMSVALKTLLFGLGRFHFQHRIPYQGQCVQRDQRLMQ